MSGFLLAAAEAGVSYAFPQVGVALQGMKLAKATISIAKAAICYSTGDVVSGTANLASIAAREGCEAIKKECITDCAMSGCIAYLGPCITKCEVAFRACMSLAG